MAKYKLLQRAFINNTLYDEGATVEVSDDMVPGSHMMPMDSAARKRFKEAGLENMQVPDFVDALTGGPDVRAYGASPQIKSGVLSDGGASDMMGAEMLQGQ
jgi:hypothetical protein